MSVLHQNQASFKAELTEVARLQSDSARFEAEVLRARQELEELKEQLLESQIAHRREREAKSLDAREQLEAILDEIPEMVWAAQPDGTHDYANRQLHDYTGIGVGATSRRGVWRSLLHPDDFSSVLDTWMRSLASGETFEVRYRLRHNSGEFRWVSSRGRPSRNASGEIVRWHGTCTDINDGVLFEQDLTRERALLQTVIDSVSDLIFVKDRASRFLMANRALAEGCGVTVGSNNADKVSEAIFQVHQMMDEEVMSTGEPREVEEVILVRGEKRLFQTVKVPWIDQGKTAGVIGVSRDITERAQAQAAQRAYVERLRSTLDTIPQLVWSTSADGSEYYFNRQWLAFTGVCLESNFDRLLLVHPDDRAEAKAAWQKATRTGEAYSHEYRIRHHSGEYRWVHSRAQAEKSSSGECLYWYGGVSDMHDRKCAELALQESELLHRSILDASVDCIELIGLDGRLELINGPGARAMEIDDVQQVLGLDWVDLWPVESREKAAAAVQEARSGRAARFTDHCPTATGKPKWWDVVVTPMKDEVGEVTQILSISRDITATREAAIQLRWTSEHDGLTDLPNRRSFQTHLQAATIRAMESGGLVGLLLIDLDHFKHVNDTLGHAAGDHLLKTFSHRLKSSVRTTDIIARLGGDEFAVLLEGVKAQDDLLRLGESILTRLSAPIIFDGRVISAGASIGGALFPNDASNANDLFKCADSALYALKGSGRGGTRMFHNYMREEAQKVASQLSLARVALSEQSVIPHYQQKVDLKSGKIRGFEALLRWKHPTLGIQQPHTVAEAFKEYELASKIGELMQRKVFSDMREWERAGIPFGRVSINASPAEFLRDDYAEKLLSRASEYQICGTLIEVEVTEHVLLDRGAEYVSRALMMLHESGVQLSLDDFGTGYSSLSHLRDFPVDVVKIDRSFIAKMLDEPEIASIVTAVIDLAGSLQLEVVAEGIETPEQESSLRDKGCGLGQGYLFGRAVVGDEVRILLER
jgi:diguanylate cyclase (GGDEF)-like protein/PAS domain S-box-containing protein